MIRRWVCYLIGMSEVIAVQRIRQLVYLWSLFSQSGVRLKEWNWSDPHVMYALNRTNWKHWPVETSNIERILEWWRVLDIPDISTPLSLTVPLGPPQRSPCQSTSQLRSSGVYVGLKWLTRCAIWVAPQKLRRTCCKLSSPSRSLVELRDCSWLKWSIVSDMRLGLGYSRNTTLMCVNTRLSQLINRKVHIYYSANHRTDNGRVKIFRKTSGLFYGISQEKNGLDSSPTL